MMKYTKASPEAADCHICLPDLTLPEISATLTSNDVLLILSLWSKVCLPHQRRVTLGSPWTMNTGVCSFGAADQHLVLTSAFAPVWTPSVEGTVTRDRRLSPLGEE